MDSSRRGRLSLLLRPRVVLAAAWLVVAIAACAPPSPPATEAPGPLRLYFLNVGQGDGALLITPDGVTVLVDGGDTNRGTGLVAWLQSLGIAKVDWIMPSHPHADHIGGLNAVLDALPVGNALVSPQEGPSATYGRQMALLAAKQVRTVPAEEGLAIPLGTQVTATVLNPPRGLLATSEPEEDNSVVLRVCLLAVCALFTGDIGDQGERALVARYRDEPGQLRSQILKVSHHGSAEPNLPELLGFIAPEVALIGAGAGNRFGHPTPTALARLAGVGATIYCTHVDGTVLLLIDGARYSVELLPQAAIPAGGRPPEPLAPPAQCGR